MLRRLVLASFSAVALSAAANAADIYVPTPAGPGGYKDEPCCLWTGFYVGVNGGYGWGNRNKVADIITTAGGALITETTTHFTPEGGFGGGQIGYNWQRDRLVYGIEADIQGADIRGHASTSAGAGLLATGSSDLDWFGTVRGRVGYVWGSALLYATGGFAYGGIQDKITKLDPGFGSLSRSETATGWVVGGGLEYCLSPKWSLKGEYQYIDLGKSSSMSIDVAAQNKVFGELDPRHSYSTVRAGLNYHFVPAYEPLK
jgi:outer membrane immunogenic protein